MIKGQKTFVKQYREQLSVPRSLVTSSTANRVMRISFSDVSRWGVSSRISRPYIFTLAHVSSPYVEQPSQTTIRGTAREKTGSRVFSRYNDASFPPAEKAKWRYDDALGYALCI